MKVDLNELTVAELLEMGADVSISFHDNKNLQQAYDKLKPFANLGKVQKHSHHSGTTWLKIKRINKNVSSLDITAFI